MTAISNTGDVWGLARNIRRIILEQSKRAHVGHIGPALSIADIVAALYSGILRTDDETITRDRFVLSKGHAVLAVYAVLYLQGRLSEAQLMSYCSDGTLLGVHPERFLKGIDFSTGSLGQGLSIGAGCALAARLNGTPSRTYVLLSDAELNEGSTWEAIMFAGHHRLDQLVAIVDNNGQQAFGQTRDVLDLRPLGEKWRAFGWQVHEVDGHAPDALVTLLRALSAQSGGGPQVLLAETVCGKGVSYMERQVQWHYLPMDESQYAQALQEVAGA